HLRQASGVRERPQRGGDDDEPSLHVEHAGAPREVAVAAPALERPRREDGVVVTDAEDAPGGRGRLEDEVIGEALAPLPLAAQALERERRRKARRDRV